MFLFKIFRLHSLCILHGAGGGARILRGDQKIYDLEKGRSNIFVDVSYCIYVRRC